MIYFTLPNFYDNININKAFVEYAREHPDDLRQEVTFTSSTGGFPYHIWNGGFVNISGKGAFYPQIQSIKHQVNALPIRINMANVLTDEMDYKDAMTQQILSAFQDTDTTIEIANLPFMDYISETYPGYKFVLSKEANLLQDLTPDMINLLTSYDKFELISLPISYNNNMEQLDKIDQPWLMELTINPLCPMSCQFRETCALQEHKMQLEYSEVTQYQDCTMRLGKFNAQLISLDMIVNTYLPMGIAHFTIDPMDNHYELVDYLEFYIQYFIKDEKQYSALLQIKEKLNAKI